MADTSIDDRVRAILSTVLGKILPPDGDIAKEAEELWDSLKHIEIIMALEQELDISFAPEDIPALTSLELIVGKVRALTAG